MKVTNYASHNGYRNQLKRNQELVEYLNARIKIMREQNPEETESIKIYESLLEETKQEIDNTKQEIDNN